MAHGTCNQNLAQWKITFAKSISQDQGTQPSDNKWRGPPEQHQAAILLPGDSNEKIRRMMNADGMIVIDGAPPGYARCAEFKVFFDSMSGSSGGHQASMQETKLHSTTAKLPSGRAAGIFQWPFLWR